MGIFSKLFGKKKKQEETVKDEVKQPLQDEKKEQLKKEARNITLEEVEKELADLDKIEEEQPMPDEKEVDTKTSQAVKPRRQQLVVLEDEEAEELVKETKVEPTKPEEPQKTVKPDEVVKPEKEEVKEPAKKDAKKTVYHIKKHDKGWQLITEGAEKAYRVFDYQKDAVQYAKDNKLEYLLYRADGTLRKDQ